MTANSLIVEITDHAVDRYKKLVVADRHTGAAVRNEIRRLVPSGSPIDPLWMSAAERSTAATPRYLAFGQELALIMGSRAMPDGRDASVVLSVITYPAVYGGEVR